VASSASRAVSAAGSVAILSALVWQLGSAPFLHGLRAVDGRAVTAAACTGLVATVACAWRWQLVARQLGMGLPLPGAVAAYYRSQLLNTVLPGGVLGDVERGVQSGRSTGDVGRGLRAVAWERVAGQVVQAGVLLLALLLFPSPLRPFLAVPVTIVAGLAVLVLLLHRGQPGERSLWQRAVRAARSDVRRALLSRSAWPGIVLSSCLVVAAHSTTFVIAAAAAGTAAPLDRLLPLALLNLVAMSVPVSVAGWGPREGAAAWSFAATGLGAAQGVAVATTYGVLAAVAVLPGLVVVVATRCRRRSAVPPLPLELPLEGPARALPGGARA
jgi:glycosyltransferase 2 family protein